MSQAARGPRRPVPQEKKEVQPFSSGVIIYQAEREHLDANRLDLILTAAQRGLTAPPVQPREFKEPKQETRRGPASPEVTKAITSKMLVSAIAEGMTNKEIGAKYGISSSAVSNLMKRHGLGSQKGVARKYKKGLEANARR